jgi:hypothetical protein
VSKFEEDSGSRRSMLMVRQLSEREALETCWIMDMMAVKELYDGGFWVSRFEGATNWWRGSYLVG